MSLEQIAANLSARIVAAAPKVLTLDIERLPGSFTADFWDLNDYKGRRIHADSVVEWPRTICAAWKWYDRKPVEFAAEWEPAGRDGMLQRIWDAYDQADIVVGHNLAAFDTKKLKTDWRDAGLPSPSPWKTVDTLRIARTEFGDESRTLDALCKRLGLISKSDRYSVEVARNACDGDKAAQRKLKAYNQGDILATEALYDRLRGWMPGHPHIGSLDGETMKCNECGSIQYERNGTVLADQIRYVGYRCSNCKANLRSVRHSRAASMRGAIAR
jgi:hypothetical protein